MKKATKKQLWINSDTLEGESIKTQQTLSIIAQGFFLVGFIIDCTRYIFEHSWLLLASNLPIVLYTGYNVVRWIIKRKTTYIADAISFSLITLNFVYAFADTILFDENIDYVIMRLVVFSIILILSSSFVLSKVLSYTITTLIILSFVVCSLISQLPNLMDNIILIPASILGVRIWVHTYMKLYNKNSLLALERKKQLIKLTELIDADKKSITKHLKHLYIGNKQHNENLNTDIEAIAKLVNYNLPEIIEQHAKDINSNENLFINQLLRKHSNLTASELKLSYMLMKGMRTKEIAHETTLAIDSVRVYRTRLRKKLNLVNKENLASYLKQFDLSETKNQT